MSGLRARGTRQRGVSLRGLRDLHLSDLLVSRGGALHRLCGQAPGGRLNRAHDSAGAVGVAAVTPLLADPTVRSEQLSQLLLGETAELLAAEGDWRRLRATHDGYEGWAHHGYLRELDAAALELWPGPGWSYGAELDAAGVRVQLPLRARVGLAAGGFVLPDGRTGQLVSGRIAARAAAIADARATPPAEWAARYFMGAPYQWGGVTPWGVDCSGLVQTTFAARDAAVPRDAHDQARHGATVPLGQARPGDLLFFRSETGDRITHVAFLSSGSVLVHSTIACGGVVREEWCEGSPAWRRLQSRLVAVRRFE
jgi:cell wall-associated NlpC family hydrolase